MRLSRRLGVALVLLLMACAVALAGYGPGIGTATPVAAAAPKAGMVTQGEPVDVVLPVKGVAHHVQLVPTTQGPRIVENGPDGQTTLTPDQFMTMVYHEQLGLSHRNWLLKLFNISRWGEIGWECLGLLGSTFFISRWLLQWVASEKAGKSIVPKAFWWSGLSGGLLLVIYWIWRQDIVGIFGQFGVIICARNLILIYRNAGPPPSIGQAPGTEPELIK